ncbi:MAG: sugar phosphate isomerase/epimerase [Verrucomicrobia bacterium]|nr:sugar phosphate isomerase/epimerase [Verrucomicrobiota bacterium]
MKVGVFTVILGSRKLEATLDYLAGLGVQAVEFGAGGYARSSHCPLEETLASDKKCRELRRAVESRGLQISALNAAGNPIHPVRKTAAKFHSDFQKVIRLANKLEVDVVINFSGCPGGAPGDKSPNWVTCPWPPDYLEILDYQWNKVVIPYWEKAVAFARGEGIRKIALEMHPGFVVYNPETLLRLRKAVGPAIGANFDPSHLFWQGIDPCAAVRALKGAIWHCHAKDTAVHEWNSTTNGTLDTKHYSDELNRSWIFRTVGYGHPRHFWCNFVSTLRMCGYDGVLSMEHEDSLMTAREGLEKGVRFLQSIALSEAKGEVTWA